MSGGLWMWIGFSTAAIALVWACLLLASAAWRDTHDRRIAEEERLTEGLERIPWPQPDRLDNPPMPTSSNVHYQPRHGWATIGDIATLRRMMYTPTQPLPFVARASAR